MSDLRNLPAAGKRAEILRQLLRLTGAAHGMLEIAGTDGWLAEDEAAGLQREVEQLESSIQARLEVGF